MEVPASMGMAIALNFQPVGERVATTGDFVLVASEVNPVIRELRSRAASRSPRSIRTCWRRPRGSSFCTSGDSTPGGDRRRPQGRPGQAAGEVTGIAYRVNDHAKLHDDLIGLGDEESRLALRPPADAVQPRFQTT